MTNPEFAAPTDMEAALRDARRLSREDVESLDPALCNLARCLLASSAEVAALREQVARLEGEREQWFVDAQHVDEVVHPRAIEAARAEERARAERDIADTLARWASAHQVGVKREYLRLAERLRAGEYDKADPGALPKSGAADADDMAPRWVWRHVLVDSEGAPARWKCTSCKLVVGGSAQWPCPRCGARHSWTGISHKDFPRPHTAATSSEPTDGCTCAGSEPHALGCPARETHGREPVERDPDDDSAWPLPAGLPKRARWDFDADDGWQVVSVAKVGYCCGGLGTPCGILCDEFPALAPLIIRRNLAARVARTKAAAPKDTP